MPDNVKEEYIRSQDQDRIDREQQGMKDIKKEYAGRAKRSPGRALVATPAKPGAPAGPPVPGSAEWWKLYGISAAPGTEPPPGEPAPEAVARSAETDEEMALVARAQAGDKVAQNYCEAQGIEWQTSAP